MFIKIYNLVASIPGIILTAILVFFICFYPIGGTTQSIELSVGEMIGSFIASFILIILLSRWYKWTRIQKIFNTLLAVAISRPIITSPLVGFVNLIYLCSLLLI